MVGWAITAIFKAQRGAIFLLQKILLCQNADLQNLEGTQTALAIQLLNGEKLRHKYASPN